MNDGYVSENPRHAANSGAPLDSSAPPAHLPVPAREFEPGVVRLEAQLDAARSHGVWGPGLPCSARPSSAAGLAATLLLCLLAAHPARAQGISFTLVDPPPSAAAGGTAVYRGTVTNATATSLAATDLFFSFSGFDPAAVRLDQLLGDPDFPLPGGTTSPVVDLFSLSLAPGIPAGQAFFFDAALEDSAGDVSGVVPVAALSAAPAAAVPEPSSAAVFAVGLALTALCLRRSLARRWLTPPSRRRPR